MNGEWSFSRSIDFCKKWNTKIPWNKHVNHCMPWLTYGILDFHILFDLPFSKTYKNTITSMKSRGFPCSPRTMADIFYLEFFWVEEIDGGMWELHASVTCINPNSPTANKGVGQDPRVGAPLWPQHPRWAPPPWYPNLEA